MACLDMYNSEHKSHHHHNHQHHCALVSPRISFSNDFVDTQASAASQQERSITRSDASSAISSDFEFSVTNYSMMSADELFSKGRLLPFKDNNCNNKRPTTTLREELLVGDDEDRECNGFSLRPPKGSSTRWKGFLGLRKSHIGSKKVDKSSSDTGGGGGGVEARRSAGLVNQGTNLNINSKDLLMEGGSSCREFEFGI